MKNTKRPAPPFENYMKRVPTVLGWCYLPVHAVALPLLLAMYAAYAVPAWDDITVNYAYYGVGVLFCAIVLGPFLRQQFDVLLDFPLRCLLALLYAFVIEYALSLVTALVLLLVEENVLNPNNEAIMAIAENDYGAVKGLVIFIGPIVEELLFRGVVFGSLQPKNRKAAYLVSMGLFCLYHVWQYALVDPWMLLYAVQYLPAAFALAWVYEHSNSIWMPIFFHMISNAISFATLSLL